MRQPFMAVHRLVAEFLARRVSRLTHRPVSELTANGLQQDRRPRPEATSIMDVARVPLALEIQQQPDPVVQVPLRQQGPRLSLLGDLLVL